MKQTLIKITDDHYVVVNDSEIKEGDWWINAHPRSYYIDSRAPIASSRFAMNSNAVFSDPKKITHSTKPIEDIMGLTNKLDAKGWILIKQLYLQEVKELICEINGTEWEVEFDEQGKLRLV